MIGYCVVAVLVSKQQIIQHSPTTFESCVDKCVLLLNHPTPNVVVKESELYYRNDRFKQVW